MKDKDGEKKEEREKKRIAKASRIKMSASATHTQMDKETRLARTIPARNASENHISGRCVVNWSCNCDADVGGLAACIGAFHDSINFRW